MFTGIIKGLGKIDSLKKSDNELIIGIIYPKTWKRVQKGNSIAVNGVCLTVFKKIKNKVMFFCQKETIDITNLSNLKVGDLVNLEQAMTFQDEFGGHMVQGHVDCTGTCSKILTIGEGWRYWIKLPKKKPAGLVLKGSVALDGISLTVSRLKKDMLSVDIIPFTYDNTNIQFWKKGTIINIETDIIGKYVEKYLSSMKK